MILHDFRCEDCGDVQEHLTTHDRLVQVCRDVECSGVSHKVILKAPQPDWAGLAMGENASPEAISRFERTHRQQREKEAKSMREHGDYGTAPGGSGGGSYTATK